VGGGAISNDTKKAWSALLIVVLSVDLTDEHGLLLVGELILKHEQLHQLAVVPLNLLPEVVQNHLKPKSCKKK
jgi:hypothetical protein